MSETWFLILRKEYRLRAINVSVIRKLNRNGDGVLERGMDLRNSWFYVFIPSDVYVAVQGCRKSIRYSVADESKEHFFRHRHRQYSV